MSSAASIERAFVTVGSRQVHYRRAGRGAPVILLHGSPRSSLVLCPLVAVLAGRFCAIALDTPGYGGSDPLARDEPEVADYADAVAEAMDALGLPRVGLYGTHTGAAIALELARRHADRITGVVLDGVPLYSDAEREERLAKYAPTFSPRIDGGHMVAMWARQRDQYLFYPWYQRGAATRRRIAMPGALELHEGVMDVLRAGDGYGTAYRAVFRHRAESAMSELTVPTLVLSREDDVLAGRADLIPLPPSAALERPAGDAEATRRIEVFLSEHADAGDAPAPPSVRQIAGRITRSYARTSFGQLLARHGGERDGVPLVMLHGSPGSAESLVGLMEALAKHGRHVIALDTLGNGESDKPEWQVAEIADYAPIVAEAVEALGVAEHDLYGTHTGAHIAAEVALLTPDRVRRLVIDGVAMSEPAYAEYLLESYTPALEPRGDGVHLLWAWNFVRDQTLFWPWFNRTPDGVRAVEPLDAKQLHHWCVEVLKSGHTYPIGYRAAFRHRMGDRLPGLKIPALMISHAADMLHEATMAAAGLAPDARGVTVPAEPNGAAQIIAEFLGES